MARFRTQMALSLLGAAALLIGCGGDEPGGGGKNDGRPRIERLEPNAGPVGSEVVIRGINFAEELAKNIIRFNGTVSMTLEVDPDRKWVRTRVPTGATTGPLTMQVDLGTGLESIEGLTFTVNDDKPKPTLSAISPGAVTFELFTEQRINLNGGGFVDGSRTIFDGVEVDAQRTGSTMLSFTLPAEAAPAVGSYEIQVINDPPGGGASEKLAFHVVHGMRFLEAEAVVVEGMDHVRIKFDRPVRVASASAQNAFRIDSEKEEGVLEIRGIRTDSNDPFSLYFVTSDQEEGAEYIFTIRTKILVSEEGGKLIGETSRRFSANQ